MINIFLEIEKLKAVLQSKGVNEPELSMIARDAEIAISAALTAEMENAMDVAIQSGVEKDSEDFINELRPRYDAFILETESSITDFSDPPFPMLDKLLASGAKPMADGSGVYKVIPMGSNNKPKQPIYTNIFDTQKALSAQRYEQALAQYNKVAPKDSKVKFRTVTSKQNSATMWVQPPKDKDFTADLQDLNKMLGESHDDIVKRIIRSYEENY